MHNNSFSIRLAIAKSVAKASSSVFRSATKSDLLRENSFKPFKFPSRTHVIFCVMFHVKIRTGDSDLDSDKVEATILMVLPEAVDW